MPTLEQLGRQVTSVDKGHGRSEKRTLRATTILTGAGWKGLKQGFRVTGARTVKEVTTVEVVDGITSLPPERADATALLALVLEHWRIENELHYVRDVTLGEDACRVRKGTAPQVLAALWNAVVHLLAGIPTATRPEGLEWLQMHPEHAQRLIGIPQCE